MMHAYEQMVRECAYFLWIDSGRMDGMAHEHWVVAEKTIAATAKPMEKPVRASKTRVVGSIEATAKLTARKASASKTAAKGATAKGATKTKSAAEPQRISRVGVKSAGHVKAGNAAAVMPHGATAH